jgi:hypothetical protein
MVSQVSGVDAMLKRPTDDLDSELSIETLAILGGIKCLSVLFKRIADLS